MTIVRVTQLHRWTRSNVRRKHVLLKREFVLEMEISKILRSAFVETLLYWFDFCNWKMMKISSWALYCTEVGLVFNDEFRESFALFDTHTYNQTFIPAWKTSYLTHMNSFIFDAFEHTFIPLAQAHEMKNPTHFLFEHWVFSIFSNNMKFPMSFFSVFFLFLSFNFHSHF